jgi:acetyl esterase/lipase
MRPVVVVIYGGAWRAGDPSQGDNVSRALAARGFAVAAIDYRHAPAFQFPSQLEDVRRSLALLRDSSAAWGLDMHHLALLGRSAGGQLAELAAYAHGSSDDVPVRAVVAIYAPYDLAEGYRDLPSPDPIDVRKVLREFLGGTPSDQEARYHAASPLSYVRHGLPATLLLYGGRDHIVKPSFNRRAAAELRAARVAVVAVELPWAEHGFDMVPAGLGGQLAFNVIAEFLTRELM